MNSIFSSCDDYYNFISDDKNFIPDNKRKEVFTLSPGSTSHFTPLQNLNFNVYLKDINALDIFRNEYNLNVNVNVNVKSKDLKDNLDNFLNQPDTMEKLFKDFTNQPSRPNNPTYIKIFDILGRELNSIYKITINKQPIIIKKVIDDYKTTNNIIQMTNNNYFKSFYIDKLYLELKQLLINKKLNPDLYKKEIFFLMDSFSPNTVNYLKYLRFGTEYREIVFFLPPTFLPINAFNKGQQKYLKENENVIAKLLDVSVTEWNELLQGVNIDIIWEPTCNIFYVVLKTIYFNFIRFDSASYVATAILIKQKYNLTTYKTSITAKHRWILDSNILDNPIIKHLPTIIQDTSFEYSFFKTIFSCVKYLDKNQMIDIFTKNNTKEKNIISRVKSMMTRTGGKTIKHKQINNKKIKYFTKRNIKYKSHKSIVKGKL